MPSQANTTIISTWYGEYGRLRKRLEEFSSFGWPVMVLNDGWPDYNQFARIVGKKAVAVSKTKDEGFCSHQLRNWAMDWCDTPYCLLTDMDIHWPEETVKAMRETDFSSAPRWMFRLDRPAKGYKPIEGDIHGRTKQDVHPNIHLLPCKMGRYDKSLYGQHTGDGEFFRVLSRDYEVFSLPIRMER